MKAFAAFTRKEIFELLRTGKLTVLTVIFILFGIMNPAIAKLTPWLLETMSDSLSDTGLTITVTEVDAMTSWTQFYKNIPFALIIFLLLFGSIFTAEYQKGTLLNMLTKGLHRWKVMLSKTVIMILLWTAGYWLCYGITYGYNAYFWNNGIAQYLTFSVFCFYLAGIWLISLIPLMSSCFRSASAVLVAIGSSFLVIYIIGLIPSLKEYLPTQLMASQSLLTGLGSPSDYLWAVTVTSLLTIVNIILSVVIFNRTSI